PDAPEGDDDRGAPGGVLPLPARGLLPDRHHAPAPRRGARSAARRVALRAQLPVQPLRDDQDRARPQGAPPVTPPGIRSRAAAARGTEPAEAGACGTPAPR